MQETQLQSKMNLGFLVFAVGTVSNVAEFALAMTVREGVMLPLIALMLIDAATIAYFFMHITQLWREEE